MMKIPLRERRRQETALEIQRATLMLAREHGFDHVTTEAIAERAGISPRTFFNYYTNKEDAVVGHPPGFPEEARAAFAEGRGPLQEAVHALLRAHLDQLEVQQDVILGIGDLWRENGRVRWLLDTRMEAMSSELAVSIGRRLPELGPGVHEGLAEWIIRTAGLSIKLWAKGGADSLTEALEIVWSERLEVARLLVS